MVICEGLLSPRVEYKNMEKITQCKSNDHYFNLIVDGVCWSCEKEFGLGKGLGYQNNDTKTKRIIGTLRGQEAINQVVRDGIGGARAEGAGIS